MTDQPTLADLTRVMDTHPLLCNHGYGKPNFDPDFDLDVDRARLVSNLDQVQTAHAWLRTLHPAGDRRWASSYELKHDGEHAGSLRYVTNGAFIAAAYLAGVPVKVRSGSVNPLIGVALTPPPVPAPAGSFTAWLAEHAHGGNPVADLARDAADDECWPTTATTYPQFAAHLDQHHAYGPAREALRTAWEAYSGQPAPADEDDL